ncbi:hypothetical protein [Eubacterium oxidoreducens]|uniref:Uncharacterized protein n=1 Tax=Eubacterium oxidoreducens TaxID=1732 RepID=A0A1G6B542_EUBOX|nr:hypothetical protein [Eubacterium oxidoreducens]SDB15770.1 hypothetical protein SAMN02910417_01186 [Eubacterium oxidoreducens]
MKVKFKMPIIIIGCLIVFGFGSIATSNGINNLFIVTVEAASTETVSGTIKSVSCTYHYGIGFGTCNTIAKNYTYKLKVPLTSKGNVYQSKVTKTYVDNNTTLKRIKLSVALTCGYASSPIVQSVSTTSSSVRVVYQVPVFGNFNPTDTYNCVGTGVVQVKVVYKI